MAQQEGVSSLVLQGMIASSHGQYAEAIKDYKKASQQGDTLGTAYLGALYLSGVGGNQPCKAQPLLKSVLNKARSNELATLIATASLFQLLASQSCPASIDPQKLQLSLLRAINANGAHIVAKNGYYQQINLDGLDQNMTQHPLRIPYVGACLVALAGLEARKEQQGNFAVAKALLKKAVQFNTPGAKEALQEMGE